MTQPTGMIVCPSCGHGNISGADTCEDCGQSLTSIVSDNSSAIASSITQDTIELLTPAPVLAVAPDAKIGDVMDLLVANKVGCVLVIEGDQIKGIFSERDVLMRLGPQVADLKDRAVSEFMTPNPQTLELTDKIAFALHRMEVGGFRHIPITSGGKPAGIISIRDILNYVTKYLVHA